jgi:hypothetical protein
MVYSEWVWRMDYCKSLRIPPAQKGAWDKAGEAYRNRRQNNGL